MKNFLFTLMIVSTTTSAFAFRKGKALQELPDGFLRMSIVTDTSAWYCSATKIAPKLYLSAAHCLTSLNNSSDPNQVAKNTMEAFNVMDPSEKQEIEVATKKLNSAIIAVLKAKALRRDPSILAREYQDADLALRELKNNQTNLRKITRVYIHPTYLQSHTEEPEWLKAQYPEIDLRSSGLNGADIALFAIDNEITEIKPAKLDLDYSLQSNNTYRLVGHNKYSSDNTKDFQYQDSVLNEQLTSSVVFYTNRGRGGVSEGDSGGPLYRFNPETNAYDTVVGVTCAINRLLGFYQVTSIYTRISRDSFFLNGKWIESVIQRELLLN